ncbi:UNVERIFIED_ORG: hypothetical protein M2193_004610 [Bradyrhizobium japonicum]
MTRSEHSNLYRAPQFRRSVSDALACDRNDVGAAIDRLLGAGRMPMVQAGLPAEIAVWADAARMIAALAGQQILHAAVVNTTDRICAMPRKLFAGGEAPAADRPFGAELASLFRHRHSIAAGPTGFPAVAVAWSQGGLALYAKFDFSERGGPKQRYHSVLPAIAGSVPRHGLPAASKLRLDSGVLLAFADVMEATVPARRVGGAVVQPEENL